MRGLRMAAPICGLAALAAYTWWLVQSMPTAQSDTASDVPASQPDFLLAQARVERFDANGERLSMLAGKAMRHFEQGDRLVIDDMAWLNVRREGAARQVQGQALEGQYSGEAGVVNLNGKARVTVWQADASVITFTGEQLRWSDADQVLRADRPVRVVGPQGVLQAGGLLYRAEVGQTALTGRVTGQLQ